MKKKTVVMLLTLSFVLGGCGSAKETNADVPQVQQGQPQEQVQESEQEQVQEETEQEEDPAENIEIGKEYTNGDIVIKVEDTEQEYLLDEGQYQKAQGTMTATEEVPVYCSQGYQIGHINSGVTVEITEHGIDSAWYRFPNPVEEAPFDYLYVSMFMADLSNINILPGTIREGAYKFEVKDEYDREEVQGIFSMVLDHYGLVAASYSDFDIHDGIHVYVPLKNTVEWAEEKKDLFIENGITYYNMEGGGEIPGVCASVKLQLRNDEKIFAKEELEQFFQSDVDLELKEKALEYDQKIREEM